MKNAEKLSVWAPETPGINPKIVAMVDTIEQARAVASRYAGRADLKMQDVYIRLGSDGRIIERCGPLR